MHNYFRPHKKINGMDKKLTYDLHIHSCLSPCGDDDMTPANIAGMGAVLGLSVMALTDHNSCGNCPSFFEACTHYGVIPIAGMELTTSEDIHLVCLFETLEAALAFDEFIQPHRMRIRNRTDIFGHQYFMDADETVLSEEPDLLTVATDLSIEQAYEKVLEYDGVIYPAHIDRDSNGIIAALGTFPDSPDFRCYELNDIENLSSYKERFPILNDLNFLVSSDAHYLEHIQEPEPFFLIPETAETPKQIRKCIFEILRGGR